MGLHSKCPNSLKLASLTLLKSVYKSTIEFSKHHN